MRAIHDRYYASPPASWDDYRWRLQLLSEERLGVRVREQARQEDVAWAAAGAALGG